MKHESTYRVPYADTDQMQVVYYANYLEYFERSRTEMFRAVGMPYALIEEKGIILPVSEAHCKYMGSARYDDLLTLRSYVTEARGARLTIASEVLRGEELLVSGSVTLCCINGEHKVTRLPAQLLEAVKLLNKE